MVFGVIHVSVDLLWLTDCSLACKIPPIPLAAAGGVCSVLVFSSAPSSARKRLLNSEQADEICQV